jgi:hypothetical protein
MRCCAYVPLVSGICKTTEIHNGIGKTVLVPHYAQQTVAVLKTFILKKISE